jgi:nucleotide-binding universal stress UspA family protein
MRKALIAIDESPAALHAVEYVAQQFTGTHDLQIGLVYVLPNLPAVYWDEGHILSDEEKKERQGMVDKWLAERKGRMEPVFQKAITILTKTGIPIGQIRSIFISDSTDIADSILEQAKDFGYQTVVLGRHENRSKHVLLGTVANKVASKASGVAVTIVE